MPTIKVAAARRNVESLLKLLGGTEDDRLRFWEILKGITTPAQFRVISKQVSQLEAQVAEARDLAKELKSAVGKG